MPVLSNFIRGILTHQKAFTSLFMKMLKRDRGHIRRERREIPEDKDDEKCRPECSESSSGKVETLKDHPGEEATLLSKNGKITGSFLQWGRQGRWQHTQWPWGPLVWQFPSVKTLSPCFIYSVKQWKGQSRVQIHAIHKLFCPAWSIFWTSLRAALYLSLLHPTPVTLIVSSMTYRLDQFKFLWFSTSYVEHCAHVINSIQHISLLWAYFVTHYRQNVPVVFDFFSLLAKKIKSITIFSNLYSIGLAIQKTHRPMACIGNNLTWGL